jgi:SPP1 family predicted phage head-tail adaptor
MQIGDLRERVTISQPSRVTDTLRGQATTWTTLDTVWAEWSDRPSREALQVGGFQSLSLHTARIRYRADVTTQMRVTKGTTVCDISGLRDMDGRRRFLELDLVEVP